MSEKTEGLEKVKLEIVRKGGYKGVSFLAKTGYAVVARDEVLLEDLWDQLNPEISLDRSNIQEVLIVALEPPKKRATLATNRATPENGQG